VGPVRDVKPVVSGGASTVMPRIPRSSQALPNDVSNSPLLLMVSGSYVHSLGHSALLVVEPAGGLVCSLDFQFVSIVVSCRVGRIAAWCSTSSPGTVGSTTVYRY
jgi:hypothetical protein